MKSPIKVIGLVVMVLGILALAYGGFSYVEETHDASLGPIDISIQDKERVNIPAWAGVVAIIGGGVMMIAGRSK